MYGTVSGTPKELYRTVYRTRMPREEYQSISIPLSVYERATQVKDEHDLTWGDLLERALHASGEGEGVQVDGIDDSVIDEIAGRAARHVKEELQGGAF